MKKEEIMKLNNKKLLKVYKKAYIKRMKIESEGMSEEKKKNMIMFLRLVAEALTGR